VSFTTSHRALMLRSSRPLLGKEMNSSERCKASWDELPFTNYGFSHKQRMEWNQRMIYELGIRDVVRTSKIRYFGVAFMVMCMLVVCKVGVYEMYIYRFVFWKFPDHIGDIDLCRTNARNKGYDVWCSDGQFVRPFFHLNAPMFTMKIEDL
jgi:hypothetical protein